MSITGRNPFYIRDDNGYIVERGFAVDGAEIIPGPHKMLVWGEPPEEAEGADPLNYTVYDGGIILRDGDGPVADYELGPQERIEYAERKSPGEFGQYSSLKPEPIWVIEAWGLNHHEAEALAHLVRHRRKDGKLDLEKAVWWIQRLIANEYPAVAEA